MLQGRELETTQSKSAVRRAIVNFTRSYIYYIETFEQAAHEQLRSNFWIHTCNNNLDTAVIEWCKVFGSERNETHWANFVSSKQQFLTGLLSRLKMDHATWKKYRAGIVDYRNKEVAHFDANFVPRAVPFLSGAYEAMKYAYTNFYVPSPGLPVQLDDYEGAYRPIAKEIISRAIVATKGIRDDI